MALQLIIKNVQTDVFWCNIMLNGSIDKQLQQIMCIYFQMNQNNFHVPKYNTPKYYEIY